MQRQVPKYCIIGDGKMARHMGCYFQLTQISYNQWSRALHKKGLSSSLEHCLNGADIALLLISDDAIESFYKDHPILTQKNCVHFSGSFFSEHISGCHPLMTFSESLYEAHLYQSIPFIVDSGVDFKSLFPELPNPVHFISPEKKTLYHSLCVMAGNFPQILWQAISKEFSDSCQLPSQVMDAYLRKVVENFLSSAGKSLTGPLQRGDQKTIAKHQVALQNSELSEIYQSFVKLFKTQNREKV